MTRAAAHQQGSRCFCLIWAGSLVNISNKLCNEKHSLCVVACNLPSNKSKDRSAGQKCKDIQCVISLRFS